MIVYKHSQGTEHERFKMKVAIGDIVRWNTTMGQYLESIGDSSVGTVMWVEPDGSFCGILFQDCNEIVSMSCHKVEVICAAR